MQLFSVSELSLSLYGQVTSSCLELVSCLFLPRLQSGMNLQICFVNDSSSDKDSDADDSKTETSLDTPLSPMVSPRPPGKPSPSLSWLFGLYSFGTQEQPFLGGKGSILGIACFENLTMTDIKTKVMTQ